MDLQLPRLEEAGIHRTPAPLTRSSVPPVSERLTLRLPMRNLHSRTLQTQRPSILCAFLAIATC